MSVQQTLRPPTSTTRDKVQFPGACKVDRLHTATAWMKFDPVWHRLPDQLHKTKRQSFCGWRIPPLPGRCWCNLAGRPVPKYGEVVKSLFASLANPDQAS
jgi:hypothetical protein